MNSSRSIIIADSELSELAIIAASDQPFETPELVYCLVRTAPAPRRMALGRTSPADHGIEAARSHSGVVVAFLIPPLGVRPPLVNVGT
jgi:hypothetical protein